MKKLQVEIQNKWPDSLSVQYQIDVKEKAKH